MALHSIEHLHIAVKVPYALAVMTRDRIVDKGPCRVEGCESPAWCSGYCQRHYFRIRRTGSAGPAGKLIRDDYRGAACEIPGCPKPAESRGLCKMHRTRLKRDGTPGEVAARTERGRPLGD